uniref:Magnesium transporter n=2 Tax=Eutreptiella gymnastica TaxID=73025 RepID=A0A7S1JBE5_9EUGL|mmetsp:Transcript_81621/g.143941  ORF Transcript_81621/g.143941 Transcript_81621/m.143941 type:complete len:448 (+) Transcript_81621:2-1345(+)
MCVPSLKLSSQALGGGSPQDDGPNQERWTETTILDLAREHSTKFFAVEVRPHARQIKALQLPDFNALKAYLLMMTSAAPAANGAGGSPCGPGNGVSPDEGFTWVDMQCTSPDQITQLGKACNLHSLTIEDIIDDAYEKTETFSRRGYLYCMVDSEDIRGNTARIHILLFKHWAFTIHDCPAAAINQTLARLDEDFLQQPEAPEYPQSPLTSPMLSLSSMCPSPLQRGPTVTHKEDISQRPVAVPAYVLHSILDVDVDMMTDSSDVLITEAEQVDQLVFIASSKEQSDVLRRISLARSRIHNLQQRSFSKQRLLMRLVSTLAGHFIPAQIKLYMRDVIDHIAWCSQRLDSGNEILAQANSNYLACISIEAAELSNRTNAMMQKLSLLATVVVPFTLVASLLGMNVRVPGQDVDSTVPFWSIVGTFGGICMVAFIMLTRMEIKQRKRGM